jgi:hypothetical protein
MEVISDGRIEADEGSDEIYGMVVQGAADLKIVSCRFALELNRNKKETEASVKDAVILRFGDKELKVGSPKRSLCVPLCVQCVLSIT